MQWHKMLKKLEPQWNTNIPSLSRRFDQVVIVPNIRALSPPLPTDIGPHGQQLRGHQLLQFNAEHIVHSSKTETEMQVLLGIATNWIDFAAMHKPANLIQLVWSPWSLEGKLSFSIFFAKVKKFNWFHGMNSMDGLSCLAGSIVGRSLCVDICLEVPLQLIYARPCNWLVIPWPQLGYSSISILRYTLSHALP